MNRFSKSQTNVAAVRFPDPCIVVVNPGSTSTKLAMFRGRDEVALSEIQWTLPAGLRGGEVADEVRRYAVSIHEFIASTGLTPEAVVGRGGFIRGGDRPFRSGVYQVAVVDGGEIRICEDIYRGVAEDPELDHASNYGIPVAAHLAQHYGIPAFTVDPIVVDDFDEVARFSGYAPVERRSLSHVLSIRAMGRRAAEQLGVEFSQSRFVAVHLGGGISVAALREGRIVDNNNALLGGGPFSPQRVGSLPMRDLIDLCYSGRFTKQELQVELTKRGGLVSYLGEDDCVRIEERVAGGDKRAETVIQAMAYQIAKEVGAMGIAVGGPLDAVVFSGGLSRSELLMGHIRALVSDLAPILVFPGSLEMEAMAHGVWRVMAGNEQAMHHKLQP